TIYHRPQWPTPPHRLNLLYLANDVIQNCKRKNAIVYRTAFAEVLVDAFLLINSDGDAKVIKSVERILSIWEERSVYEGNLISDLRNTLVKEESLYRTTVQVQEVPGGGGPEREAADCHESGHLQHGNA
uniref:CID domain-containing protein n=1 Tax=Neogobius melanostomus TaxID=47308 RepID=A0A8C6SE88_9GOBI